MSTLNVYVGFDPREQKAFDVCEYSILKHATHRRQSDTKVIKLYSKDIPEYKRPHEPTQSTDFTYTRFFVPYLNNFYGYAVFVDCDFLFLDDIRKIVDNVDPLAAVSVVKHPLYIPNTQIKMDDIPQHQMWRKNWASLIVFNCDHPICRTLTPEYVNNKMPGRALHQFEWCGDDFLGSIPLDWNCLDGYYVVDKPKAIHYTDGGPWFDDYENKPFYKYSTYSHLWSKAQKTMLIEKGLELRDVTVRSV